MNEPSVDPIMSCFFFLQENGDRIHLYVTRYCRTFLGEEVGYVEVGVSTKHLGTECAPELTQS